MSVDTTYIVNQFKLPHTVNVEVANIPDTFNVHVVDNVMSYTQDVLLDSMAKDIQLLRDTCSYIAHNGGGYPDFIKVLAIPLLIQTIAIIMPLVLSVITNISSTKSKYSLMAIVLKNNRVILIFLVCLISNVVLTFIYVVSHEICKSTCILGIISGLLLAGIILMLIFLFTLMYILLTKVEIKSIKHMLDKRYKHPFRMK